MVTYTRRFALVALLAVAGVAFLATGAQAQFRSGPPVRAFPSVQSMYQPFVPTQLQQSAIRQWAHNTTLAARVYRRVPPYLFGYNPYPQVVNTGPVFQSPYYRHRIPPVYPGTVYAPTYPYGPYGGYSAQYPQVATPYTYPTNPYSSYALPYSVTP
ncbi:MAG: hypothetical protein IT429_13280 [Gemmataceae bacterium]|nr:hypothetical protein [Gemmataceae bacterium]